MTNLIEDIVNYHESLGFVAAALGAFSFLPQVIKILKSHSVKDISFAMYIIYWISVLLWLIYGIIIKSTPLIVAEILTGILVSVILVAKYLWK